MSDVQFFTQTSSSKRFDAENNVLQQCVTQLFWSIFEICILINTILNIHEIKPNYL